jgi:hypothetical protein
MDNGLCDIALYVIHYAIYINARTNRGAVLSELKIKLKINGRESNTANEETGLVNVNCKCYFLQDVL